MRLYLLFSFVEALLSESLSLSLDELLLESEDSDRPRECCGNLTGLFLLLWMGDIEAVEAECWTPVSVAGECFLCLEAD